MEKKILSSNTTLREMYMREKYFYIHLLLFYFYS